MSTLWGRRQERRRLRVDSRSAIVIATVLTGAWIGLIAFGLFLAVAQPFTL